MNHLIHLKYVAPKRTNADHSRKNDGDKQDVYDVTLDALFHFVVVRRYGDVVPIANPFSSYRKLL